jgi:Glycosyl hydrolase 108
MATRRDFDQAFELVIGSEGGYSDDRNDPGNWTGGEVGVGELKGTKYGVSAASYPDLNIKGLTVDDAKTIYERDYWNKAGCPDMPPRLAYTCFDAAVNNGVGRAVRWATGRGRSEPGRHLWGADQSGTRPRRRPRHVRYGFGVRSPRPAHPVYGRARHLEELRRRLVAAPGASAIAIGSPLAGDDMTGATTRKTSIPKFRPQTRVTTESTPPSS